MTVLDYSTAQPAYKAAGWEGALPLPAKKKHPPPEGFTGKAGRFPTADDVAGWAGQHGNLALRLPAGVVGLDVDHYGSKVGGDELRALEQAWGPLPTTWTSTARPAPSGIRLYRVPPAVAFRGEAGPSIEVIQRGHRYLCAWPSYNQEAGAVVRWIDPAGQVVDRPPRPDELAELPAAWVEGLRADRPKMNGTTGTTGGVDQAVNRALGDALVGVAGAAGSRHDATLAGVLALERYVDFGLAGAAAALNVLHGSFVGAVAGDGTRSPREAEAEWDRMVDGARSLIATTPSTDRSGLDSDRGWKEWLAEASHVAQAAPAAPTGTGEAAQLPATSSVEEDAGASTAATPPASDADVLAAATAGRLRPGGAYILDVPEQPVAIWGQGGDVLWSAGEGLILAGPTGVGKTTLSGQLILARAGVGSGVVLGYPVQPGQKKVLYLASDRPQQIGRALRRLVSEADRQLLDDRLVIWPGPPPRDLAKMPDLLLAMAHQADADTVALDSLKDVAVGLSADEVGSAVNTAMQLCIADGVELIGLHHQRKMQNGSKPNTLDDVYGSVWLTSGAGSVVLLWGQAGDPIVELIHLKQPSEQVGPLRIEHDHHAGTSTVVGGFDPLRFLTLRPGGATALDVARAWFEKDTPTDAERAKARRGCERLVREKLAEVASAASTGGAGGSSATVYRAVSTAWIAKP